MLIPNAAHSTVPARWLFAAGVALCFLSFGSNAAAQAPTTVHSWEKILQKWNTRAHFQALGQRENSLQYLKEIRQLQQEGGLSNLPMMAANISREALSLEGEERLALMEEAVELAPDEGLPLGVRTSQELGPGSFHLGSALTQFSRYWAVVTHDPFQLSPIIICLGQLAAQVFFWLALALSLCMALRTTPLLFLDLRRRVPLAVPTPLLTLTVMMAVALAWLYAGAAGALLIFFLIYWKFLNLQERLVAAVLLLGLAAAPLWLRLQATALSFGPQHSLYQIYRADRQPQLEEAVARLLPLKTSRPQDERIPFQLALLEKRQGKLVEARREIDLALQLRPDWPEALANRGVILFGLGQEEASLADLRRAVQLDGRLFAAHYNLGKLLFRRAALEEARSNLSRAQNLDGERFAAQEAKGKRNEASLNLFLAEAKLPRPSFLEFGEDARRAAQALLAGAGPRNLTQTPWLWPLLLLWLPLCQLLAKLLWPRSHPRHCRSCGEAYDLDSAPIREGEGLCIQCINIYQRKAAIEPGTRAAKERRVHWYRRLHGPLQNLAGLLVSGSAYALDGLALVAALQLLALLLALSFWLTPLSAPLSEYVYDHPLLLLGRYATLAFFALTYLLNLPRLFSKENAA